MLKRTFTRFKDFIKTKLFSFALASELRKPNINSDLASSLKGSGIIGSRNFDTDRVFQMHSDGMKLLQDGSYFRGLTLIKNVHEALYSHFADSSGEFYPPYLSREWTNAFGHIPNIASLLSLKKCDLIEHVPLKAILATTFKNHPLINRLKTDISFHGDILGDYSWSQLPIFLHYFLGQNYIWSKRRNDFVEIDWLADKMYAADQPSHFLRWNLPQDYLESSEAKLERLGIKKNDWFITLHIRDSGDSDRTLRNPNIEKYVKVIDWIGRQGGKILRIGLHGEAKLPPRGYLLDCTTHKDSLKDIHMYALAKAKLFIGTESGPFAYPRVFGTPGVITNVFSVGRAITSGDTISLPVKYTRNGRRLNYYELLRTRIAWSYAPSLSILREENLEYESNSADEIIGAVAEKLYQQPNDNQYLDKVRRQVLSELPWTSSGKISNEWLNRNSEFIPT